MTDSPRWMEYVRIDTVQPADRNPKEHDEALIDASIERFGFADAPIIDERTGKLVGGHGRIERLAEAMARGDDPPDGVEVTDDGMWSIPMQRGWRSTDDDEAFAAGVALNRVGERGGWDFHALHEGLRNFDADRLSGLGFDLDDLADFTASLGEPLDLDAMVQRYGQHDPDSLWPIIRLQVPPDVHARYMAIMSKLGDGTEVERFGALIDRVVIDEGAA